MQKLLSLIASHLFSFVFIVITLGGGFEKIFLWFMLASVWPMFSSKRFIVSGFTFRSLIYFEFIFYFYFFVLFLLFLRPLPRHMEVPRLGVKSEL